MHTSLAVHLVALAALLTTAGAGCVTTAASGSSFTAPRSPQLTFVADESSLERTLGAFLEAQGIKVLWRGDDSDVWLVTVWEGTGGAPQFVVVIDTLQSSVVGGVARERAVLLRLETRYTVPSEDTHAVLAQLNAHHATNWAGSWYINPKDRELEGSWAINIPAEVAAIEAGLVQDALVRIVVSWRELAEALRVGGESDPSQTL